MSASEYIKFKKSEILDLILISITLGFLFSFSYYIYAESSISIIYIFIMFFLYILTLLSIRLLVMKYVGFKNAFEIFLHMTFFDRFWVRSYDKLSYYEKKGSKTLKRESNFKGIATPILSVIIYILTLGTVIFPSMWNYKIKKIPYLHLGTKQVFETSMPHLYNIEISDYRYSKALFAGFVYYFLFAIVMRLIYSELETYYNWLTFILYWIAFISILPIMGTEGYEFWNRNNILWLIAVLIMSLGMLSLVIFTSITYSLILAIIAIIISVMILIWKKLME